MTRRARCGLALLLAGAALSPPATAAGQRWTVILRGHEAREAAPAEVGGVLFVDATALAGALGLTVRVEQMQLEIRDGAGIVWRGRPGAALLESLGRAIPLEAPWRLEGASARLPIAAVAVLAGLHLTLDPAARVARLEPTAPPVPAGSIGGDWQLLTIAKPAGGEADSPRDPLAPPPAVEVLPPTADALRSNLGMSWVQDGDQGADLDASGSFLGVDTQLASLMSWGADGPRLDYGRLALTDRAGGWQLLAGDLFSEVAGASRGLSLGLDRGWRHRPGLALYLPQDRPGGREHAVLALRDEFEVGELGSVAGEAGSDGSWLIRGRFDGSPLSLSGYRRRAGGEVPEGDGFGLSAMLGLFADLSLQASYQRTGTGARRFEFWSAGLRAPVHARLDLRLETSHTESANHESDLQALAAFVPLGFLQLYGRVQRQSSETTSQPGLGLRRDELAAFASASYTLPRLQLGVQVARFAPEDGAVTGHQQVVASWALSQATRLAFVGAFDDHWAPSDYRIGLRHIVSDRLELGLEYGRIPDFQSAATDPGGAGPGNRFKVTVRTRWDVATPAGGEVVEGAVRDPLGRPLDALPVRLGDYRTFSDAAGRYRFAHVPAGSYELSLDEKNLPASFARGSAGHSVNVAGRGRQAADLTAVPLGSVRGRVELEGPEGRRGMPGVLVLLDDRATRTGADGSFAFWNVEPGQHLLRLDTSRLPAQLVARVPWELQVGLPPGRSLDGVLFRLEPRPVMTVLQEMP